MKKRFCTELLLLLCAILLTSCVHYLPRDTQGSETTQHETLTEPAKDHTDDSRPNNTTDDGFPNDPEPDGTKRY